MKPNALYNEQKIQNALSDALDNCTLPGSWDTEVLSSLTKPARPRRIRFRAAFAAALLVLGVGVAFAAINGREILEQRFARKYLTNALPVSHIIDNGESFVENNETTSTMSNGITLRTHQTLYNGTSLAVLFSMEGGDAEGVLASDELMAEYRLPGNRFWQYAGISLLPDDGSGCRYGLAYGMLYDDAMVIGGAPLATDVELRLYYRHSNHFKTIATTTEEELRKAIGTSFTAHRGTSESLEIHNVTQDQGRITVGYTLRQANVDGAEGHVIQNGSESRTYAYLLPLKYEDMQMRLVEADKQPLEIVNGRAQATFPADENTLLMLIHDDIAQTALRSDPWITDVSVAPDAATKTERKPLDKTYTFPSRTGIDMTLTLRNLVTSATDVAIEFHLRPAADDLTPEQLTRIRDYGTLSQLIRDLRMVWTVDDTTYPVSNLTPAPGRVGMPEVKFSPISENGATQGILRWNNFLPETYTDLAFEILGP